MNKKLDVLFQYKRAISIVFVFLLSSCLFFSVPVYLLHLTNNSISSETFVSSPMCHKQVPPEKKEQTKGVCCFNKLFFKDQVIELGPVSEFKTVYVNQHILEASPKFYYKINLVFKRTENRVGFLGFS